MRKGVALMGSALAVATVSFAARANAESHASATGKGITGGALLGGEVVMLTEAAIGVQPAWLYIVGGAAGAIGGGVGGYFIENGVGAKTSILMLAGGMALIIPTTVAVLSATAYEPPADYTEDRGPSDEPAAEPPQPTAQSPKRSRTASHTMRHESRSALRLTPPTLFDIGGGMAQIAIPDLQIRELYSRVEREQFGVRQGTEVRLSFLNVLF